MQEWELVTFFATCIIELLMKKIAIIIIAAATFNGSCEEKKDQAPHSNEVQEVHPHQDTISVMPEVIDSLVSTDTTSVELNMYNERYISSSVHYRHTNPLMDYYGLHLLKKRSGDTVYSKRFDGPVLQSLILNHPHSPDSLNKPRYEKDIILLKVTCKGPRTNRLYYNYRYQVDSTVQSGMFGIDYLKDVGDIFLNSY